jgi:hypothetical protein
MRGDAVTLNDLPGKITMVEIACHPAAALMVVITTEPIRSP